MIAEKDPYIKSAYDQLQIISQDEQKRLEYEAREKAILDYNQSIYEAEQRGEKRGELRGEKRGELRGEKRGEQRGEKRGEQRGRLQGEKAVRESTAKNLIQMGISAEIIAQATGLSIAQIEAFKNEIV